MNEFDALVRRWYLEFSCLTASQIRLQVHSACGNSSQRKEFDKSIANVSGKGELIHIAAHMMAMLSTQSRKTMLPMPAVEAKDPDSGRYSVINGRKGKRNDR